MEINPHFPRCKSGSVTLVALCFSTVLAIALGSYLTLCYRSYSLSTRQIYQDTAAQLAQVGLEEALWALNQNSWSSSGPSGSASWVTAGTDQTIDIQYTSLAQGMTGSLSITVSNYNSTGTGSPPIWPIITSKATINLNSGQTTTKTLRATTKAASLFGNAVAAPSGSVFFQSSGTVDSYNSSLGDGSYYSISPPFSAASPNIGSAAVIAAPNVTITNAIVNGYATTYGASTSISGLGRVKNLSAAATDYNRLGTSAFIPAFTVIEPTEATNFTGRITGGTQTIGTPGVTEYWYTDQTGSTYSRDLLLDTNQVLTINGPVKLRVYHNLVIQSTGQINVNAPGRLELFIGNNISIRDSGAILNNTTGKRPQNVALFSTSSWDGNRSFTYSSSADFTGVIYSADPSRALTISSNPTPTFTGAIFANYDVVFAFGTNPIFHYDISLRNLTKNWFSNVITPFIVDKLTEL